MVLRRGGHAPGMAVAHPDRRRAEVDVPPGEGEQLALAHAGLEREQEQRAVLAVGNLGEEQRQFVLCEVGRLLTRGTGPLRPGKAPDWVLCGDAMLDRRGKARAEYSQVLRSRGVRY